MTSARGSARRLQYQPGVPGWPNRVPMIAMSSPYGTPSRGTVRLAPVRAPVVVTVSTGIPASSPDEVTRPPVAASRALST